MTATDHKPHKSTTNQMSIFNLIQYQLQEERDRPIITVLKLINAIEMIRVGFEPVIKFAHCCGPPGSEIVGSVKDGDVSAVDMAAVVH